MNYYRAALDAASPFGFYMKHHWRGAHCPGSTAMRMKPQADSMFVR